MEEITKNQYKRISQTWGNLEDRLTTRLFNYSIDEKYSHWIDYEELSNEQKIKAMVIREWEIMWEFGLPMLKSWMMGCNGKLDGESPAYVLRHKEDFPDFDYDYLAGLTLSWV